MDMNLQLLTLIAIYFLTWVPMLKGGWVSDDWEGIAKFSERFVDGKKISTYEHNGKQYGFGKFNPEIPFPGSVIRWLRLVLGRKFETIGKNEKGHDVYGYIQKPFRHHLISFCIHLSSVILLYLSFSKLFSPDIAFFALLLFVVHPATTQAVAWCSGIGYLLCLFGASITLFLVVHCSNLYILLPCVTAASFLSAYGLFSGTLNFIPLLYLGYPLPALFASFAIIGTGISQAKNITGVRKKEFNKQNMSRSTYWNWRKPIVMVKTYWYYMKLVVFPKQLGLFHTWGYHYDDRIERTDKTFWCGLSCLCLIWFAFGIGNPACRFLSASRFSSCRGPTASRGLVDNHRDS